MLDKSLVMKKAGPLPVWAWMGLALGLALAFSTWSKNKTNSKKQQQPPATPDSGDYPDSVKTPQYTFIDQDTTLITNKYEPPGGGRPPWGPRAPHTPGVPPRPPAPTPTPQPAPTPPPPAAGPPPAPNGSWETVVKWAKGQPKGTPSTLWGIAEKNYGSGSNWGAIWNAPQNAGLRNSRKAPEKIQPGDRVWVPK